MYSVSPQPDTCSRIFPGQKSSDLARNTGCWIVEDCCKTERTFWGRKIPLWRSSTSMLSSADRIFSILARFVRIRWIEISNLSRILSAFDPNSSILIIDRRLQILCVLFSEASIDNDFNHDIRNALLFAGTLQSRFVLRYIDECVDF